MALLSFRPMFGRGGGGAGNGFDARQKIGPNDVRQRLGGGAGNDKHNIDQIYCFSAFLLIQKEKQNLSSLFSISGERCQRQTGPQRRPLQNPRPRRSRRRPPGRSSDDQLAQTCPKSVQRPHPVAAVLGRRAAAARPEPSAADQDPNGQRSGRRRRATLRPQRARTEHEGRRGAATAAERQQEDDGRSR